MLLLLKQQKVPFNSIRFSGQAAPDFCACCATFACFSKKRKRPWIVKVFVQSSGDGCVMIFATTRERYFGVTVIEAVLESHHVHHARFPVFLLTLHFLCFRFPYLFRRFMSTALTLLLSDAPCPPLAILLASSDPERPQVSLP